MPGGQKRKGETGRRWGISLIGEVPDREAASIVVPDFRHAQRRVNRKLARRIMGQINFNHEVGWRIAAEIKPVFSSNLHGVLDIKTVISFRAFSFGFELQGSGAVAEDFLIQLVAENEHQIMQEILVFFVLVGRSHNLQPSIILAAAAVSTLSEPIE